MAYLVFVPIQHSFDVCSVNWSIHSVSPAGMRVTRARGFVTIQHGAFLDLLPEQGPDGGFCWDETYRETELVIFNQIGVEILFSTTLVYI